MRVCSKATRVFHPSERCRLSSEESSFMLLLLPLWGIGMQSDGVESQCIHVFSRAPVSFPIQLLGGNHVTHALPR